MLWRKFNGDPIDLPITMLLKMQSVAKLKKVITSKFASVQTPR